MSALGHKRTYAMQQPMSALLSIATAKANSRKGACPLYPRKRTCAVRLGMSALCQKRTLICGLGTSAKCRLTQKRDHGGGGFLGFCHEHEVACARKRHQRNSFKQLSVFWRCCLVVSSLQHEILLLASRGPPSGERGAFCCRPLNACSLRSPTRL